MNKTNGGDPNTQKINLERVKYAIMNEPDLIYSPEFKTVAIVTKKWLEKWVHTFVPPLELKPFPFEDVKFGKIYNEITWGRKKLEFVWYEKQIDKYDAKVRYRMDFEEHAKDFDFWFKKSIDTEEFYQDFFMPPFLENKLPDNFDDLPF